MKYHHIKTWPKYFDAVAQGRKAFEIRKDDRNYEVGDVLVLVEFDINYNMNTGRVYEVEVTYITKAEEFEFLQPGVVVMSIRRRSWSFYNVYSPEYGKATGAPE